MINEIAKIIVAKMIKNNVIIEEDEEIYLYGAKLFISKVLILGFITIIALITGTVFAGLVFVPSYMILREYTGGHHCKKSRTCTFVSVLIYFIFAFLYKINSLYFEEVVYTQLAVAIFAFVIIFFLSPIQNENRPLEKEEYIEYRKKAIIISSIFLIVGILFMLCKNIEISFALFSSLTVDSVLMILEKLLKRRGKNEDLERNS